MRGLIYCAGYGTRLGALTRFTPKPMIPVGGKPVLEHIVNHLNDYGVSEIIVNLHYLPHVIMEHFGTRLLYAYEPTLLGEKETLKGLWPWLRGDYAVVMNGDTLTDINIQRLRELGGTYEANITSYAGNIFTGTRLLHPTALDEMRVQTGCWWQDCGTISGLESARRHIER